MVGKFEGREFSYARAFADACDNHAREAGNMFPTEVLQALYMGLRNPMEDIEITKPVLKFSNWRNRAKGDAVTWEFCVKIAGVTSQKITLSERDYDVSMFICGLRDGLMHTAVSKTRYIKPKVLQDA